jgi:Uncharacterized protein conserved in bacteria
MIISAYRSAHTNAMLRERGGGVAKRSLQHVRARHRRTPEARATANMRDAAPSLGRGDVGYYPQSDFVHLDTGRLRSWRHVSARKATETKPAAASSEFSIGR